MKLFRLLLRVSSLSILPLMLSPSAAKANDLVITYNVSQNQTGVVGAGFTAITFTGSITNVSAKPVTFQTSGGPVPFEPYVASFTGGIPFPGITLAPGASTGIIPLAIVNLQPFDPTLSYPGHVKIVLVAIDPKTGNIITENDANILVLRQKANLFVDDDKVQCPTAAFSAIQDAVNAAQAGDVIHVCPGVYREQVVIRKSLAIEADSGAVLIPAAMQQNAASLLDGSPIAAAILVAGATDVSIEGLIVDGANNGVSQCSPRLLGIMFQNASGEINGVAVRNFRLGANLGGCQSGTGIFVQSGGGSISKVEIENCSIHDFQKNGITANEVGTRVSVHGNVVTGIGPTTGAAQNGIQIGFGAGGTISKNTVTNNLWSPCTAVDACQAVATNILVTQSDGVDVSENEAGIAQVAIFLHGNEGSIGRNQTFATSVFDGIRLEGDENRVRHNQVFNGAQAGIFVDGNNNVVEHNRITEAAIGILKQAGSLGNLIRFNQVFDSLIAVQDPPSHGLASITSPER